MAQTEKTKESSKLSGGDAYFKAVQSWKKLPPSLQETLTAAFERIPVSSFPPVPGGKVIEIMADASITDAVKILSEQNILSAPVKNPDTQTTLDWKDRYLGIVDYSAIVVWVLESAELAAVTLSASTAAAAGIGAASVGALGTLALGMTGPAAVAGLIVAAACAAVAGVASADKGAGKDAATASNKLGEDFYKVILQEEPLKSTTVRSILKCYRRAPFLPVATDSSMGMEGCRGRDWFDCIAARPISDVGLPFRSANGSNELILEAFKKLKDNENWWYSSSRGITEEDCGECVHKRHKALATHTRTFLEFQLTAKDFMSAVGATSQDSGKLIPPITCQLESTLGRVIHILASKCVHRIYAVADDGAEVSGVITLTDVISCFISETPNYLDNHFRFSVREMLSQ